MWKTRTRNKLFAVGGTFISLCIIAVLVGWFMGRTDAPGMLAALVGSGGLWGALNALAIAWENVKKTGSEPIGK